MNFKSIKETCIYVNDLEATKAFYAGKLGLPVISEVAGRHIFFRAGTSVLLCFIAEKTREEKILPPHGAYGCIHFAFEVGADEYNFCLQKIKDKGIEILHLHLWKGDRRSFYFNDPDGHLVEILEEGLWD